MAEVKYNNHTKKCARCWCWNQVEQRVPKGATVLVLIGDTDFELKEGTKRGFKVVGIDTNKQSVDAWRGSGGIGIADDFLNQLMILRPDAIIFDGLSGINHYTLCLMDVARYSTKAVVWNGLRGRDPVGSQQRKLFERHDFKIAVFKKGKFSTKLHPGIHRGMILYAHEFLESVKHFEEIEEDYPYPYEKGLLAYTTKLERRTYLAGACGDMFMQNHKPEFMSYRSKDSGQYFDTAAWTSLPNFYEHGMKADWKTRTPILSLMRPEVPVVSKRKAAAAKALLTMRHG